MISVTLIFLQNRKEVCWIEQGAREEKKKRESGSIITIKYQRAFFMWVYHRMPLVFSYFPCIKERIKHWNGVVSGVVQ